MGTKLVTNLYLCVANLKIDEQEVSVQRPVQAPSELLADALFQMFLPELLFAQGIVVGEDSDIRGDIQVTLKDSPEKRCTM